MSDLDARVAALMEFVDAYADTQFRDEYETHDAEITQARDAAITALRAALQKPALHEPAAWIQCYHCPSLLRCGEKGYCEEDRAKPAQEEITDALGLLQEVVDLHAVVLDHTPKSFNNRLLKLVIRANSIIRASKGEKT